MVEITDDKKENYEGAVSTEEHTQKITTPSNVFVGQQPTQSSIQQKMKMLIITEQGIKIDGFDNIYEVLGFIDIHVDPERIKRSIIESVVSANKNV